jgi:DNA (cytosine-5)-methyltransferase 1
LFEPCHTITTSPGHFGVVSAWLIKYYSSGENAVTLDEPLPTITTKDRFGLASAMIEIQGEKYILEDILLRMLKPEELKLMQGFPKDYIIAYDYKWNPYPKTQQVARIGNSVVPIMAKAIIEANCSEIKVGDRKPKLYIMPNDGGQMAFA